MLYRTKAAIKILMELTEKEALELSVTIGDVQDRFYIGTRMIPFDALSKEEAASRIRYVLSNGGLDIPAHLRRPLERFLELMINEGARMDKLVDEYDSVHSLVLDYDLFKPDTPEKPIKELGVSLSGATDPKNGPEDKLEKESERRKGLSDIADKIVDSLMERDMTFYEMLSVIDTAHAHLKAERALYRRRLDNTPIKGLWAMEERGQQEDG